MCLPILGAAVSAAGAVLGGIQANKAAKMQANALRRQAGMERSAGAYQASLQGNQLDRLIGRQANSFAANGLGLDGSPADVLEASRKEGELDIAATLYGANVRADNLNTQAKIVRAQGKDAMTAGFVGGLSSLVGGFGRTYIQGSFA